MRKIDILQNLGSKCIDFSKSCFKLILAKPFLSEFLQCQTRNSCKIHQVAEK